MTPDDDMSASVIDEGNDDSNSILDEPETRDLPEATPKGSESVNTEVKKKRVKKGSSLIPAEIKMITDMASSATKVLSNISSCKTQDVGKDCDKDWDFCRFLYHKLKAIPEGDVKNELELHIQQLVCQAKRQAVATGDTSTGIYWHAPPTTFGTFQPSYHDQGAYMSGPSPQSVTQYGRCQQMSVEPQRAANNDDTTTDSFSALFTQHMNA